MRFLVDAHLGTLAKALRMLGYDAALAHHEDDRRLIRWALAEDRLLLTRDLDLARSRAATHGPLRALFLRPETAPQQLAEVVRALGLSTHQPFTRCLVCNVTLSPIAPKEAAPKIPPYVSATQTEFSECPVCSRVYWRGTHWRHMAAEIREAIGSET